MLFKLTFLVEIMIWVLGLWFIITQIILPGLSGSKMFPILRVAPREADQKLAEAYEAAQVKTTLDAAQSVAPKIQATKPRRK